MRHPHGRPEGVGFDIPPLSVIVRPRRPTRSCVRSAESACSATKSSRSRSGHAGTEPPSASSNRRAHPDLPRRHPQRSRLFPQSCARARLTASLEADPTEPPRHEPRPHQHPRKRILDPFMLRPPGPLTTRNHVRQACRAQRLKGTACRALTGAPTSAEMSRFAVWFDPRPGKGRLAGARLGAASEAGRELPFAWGIDREELRHGNGV